MKKEKAGLRTILKPAWIRVTVIFLVRMIYWQLTLIGTVPVLVMRTSPLMSPMESP
ncbi:MAG: hypothetical protein GWM98_22045, partial [Nitrospinaceae bacterium]|nr:hypothetical protein [Nitrospinaceae bacterium]NIY17369.1 hypothetical protein [Nitrospinaceae bacterium]